MFCLVGVLATGIDVNDAKLISQAATSRDHIAFIYFCPSEHFYYPTRI